MQHKIEKAFALFNTYEGLHELTEEEVNKLSDLTYLFFANLIESDAADLYGALVRAIFNMGYEAGQKAGVSHAETE